jgi:hypothetical protein
MDWDTYFIGPVGQKTAGPDWGSYFTGPKKEEDWREREARENLAAMQPQDPGTTEIRGNILPLSRNVETNKLSFATPNAIYDPATLPGDVYTGKVDPRSEEGLQRSLGFAAATLPSNIARGPRFRPGQPEPAPVAPKNTMLPKTEDLKSLASSLYKEWEDAGVTIKPQAFNRLAYGLRKLAEDELVGSKLHPGSHSALSTIYSKRVLPPKQDPMSGVTGVVKKSPDRTFPLAEIDNLRRQVKTASKGHKEELADDRRIASIAEDRIDEWLESLGPKDIAAGDYQKAMAALTRSRPMWARYRKAELMDEVRERAMDKVGANYSAAGLQTAIRQELKAIRGNPSKFRRFSKPEQAVIKSLVRGGSFENMLRMLGKFDPIGGGAMQAVLSLAAGHMTGTGPVLNAAGFAANRASTRMTKNKLNKLDALIRRGYDEEGASY